MPYYKVANLSTVTMTNMIDEMPCAYGTRSEASGPIYILLMYPMNRFRLTVRIDQNATVVVYHRILTEREEMVMQRSDSDMQHNRAYCRQVRSSQPPGCL